MTDDVRAAIAERMNRLDPVGVRWDRCVPRDGRLVAYGWIPRDDGRSDFVVLDFEWGTTTGLDGSPVEWLAVGHTNSSAKHSGQIGALLGGADDGHKECERVEDVFGALVTRKIELAAT